MFNIYADFREDIEQERRLDESYYEDSCELLQRLEEIEKEEGDSDDRPSREEIKDFWRDEAKALLGAPLRKRKQRKAKQKADTSESKNVPQPAPSPAEER
jgi:hypothetical protein